MMRHIRCAGVIFHDDKHLLLEDRRKIKKHGEHWSFFGGSIEKGESIEKALKREVKEELTYPLKNYEFFNTYHFKATKDLELTYYMYIAPIPKISELTPTKKSGLKKSHIQTSIKTKNNRHR